ncbi:MAG TPA: hypothetical protein VMC07_00895 [Candidatus Omnitrophota bacterium]|nr:hypothetical protein [Candidatus Omnitrophota bacterium]
MSNVPVLAKVIAVLFYIGIGVSAILGLILILGGNLINSLFGEGALFLLFGFLMFGFAVLDFFLGKGIWNGKNWARIAAIIISVIGIIGSIYYIISNSITYSAANETINGVSVYSMYMPLIITYGLIGIIISGLIGGYLLFSKRVKAAFKK